MLSMSKWVPEAMSTYPFQRMCDVLGFTNAETQELKNVVEKTAMLCSHANFIEQFKLSWQKRPLADLFGE